MNHYQTLKRDNLRKNLTSNKISKTIDRVKSSKSQGPDNIHVMIIKECKNTLLLTLKIIFQKSVEGGKIPEILKAAHVSTIFKPGSKWKPENYRPFSLTSVPGKLLKRLIRDEIVEHMTTKNLFAKSQHGFRAGKSCITHLLEFRDKGEDVDAIYLDFGKAFDRVPHKRLLKQQWEYGIRGNIHTWIKDFLSNRTRHVKITAVRQNQYSSQVGYHRAVSRGPSFS